MYTAIAAATTISINSSSFGNFCSSLSLSFCLGPERCGRTFASFFFHSSETRLLPHLRKSAKVVESRQPLGDHTRRAGSSFVFGCFCSLTTTTYCGSDRIVFSVLFFLFLCKEYWRWKRCSIWNWKKVIDSRIEWSFGKQKEKKIQFQIGSGVGCEKKVST